MNQARLIAALLPLVACGLCVPSWSAASGIYQDGASARAKSLGGSSTAGSAGALDALATNPAALTEVRRPAVELGTDAGWVHGDFSNRDDSVSIHWLSLTTRLEF